MTQITNDHAEWAVIGRLGLMLEEPPHRDFSVTQAYALFTTILCWVVQRIRIRPHEIKTPNDRIAQKLFEKFGTAKLDDDPWRIHVASTTRIAATGRSRFLVPAPDDFQAHRVDRFLKNLRDATAHGDARNVAPFNIENNGEHLLAGFTFTCAEFTRDRKKIWDGTITLLESDMRRIGAALAKCYCDALRRDEPHRRDSHFGRDAALIKEVAA